MWPEADRGVPNPQRIETRKESWQLCMKTGDYQTAQTLETFGFLPPMTQDEIHEQIAYVLAHGWTPAIEHEHPVPVGQSVLDDVEAAVLRRDQPEQRSRRTGGLPPQLP